MNTRLRSKNSFEAGWASFELVKVFGDRIYSLARHITQNDDAAEDVLIETFLEVCSELDGCQEDEKVGLRLVTIAIRKFFSKLHNRVEGPRLLDGAADSYDGLVLRELSIWGDNYQQRYSRARTARVLEHGLRSLDPMCRTVFVLGDIEEIPVEHIAKIVNRGVAAVEVCLLRARLQLREMLVELA
jgi:RNA polymerase sigma factor (sigma-70 family)